MTLRGRLAKLQKKRGGRSPEEWEDWFRDHVREVLIGGPEDLQADAGRGAEAPAGAEAAEKKE